MTQDRSIGLAVVGWGGIAKVHALALRALPVVFPDSPMTVRQTLVVTRDVAGKRAPIQRAGFSDAVATIEQALSDTDTIAVDICTPNDLHLSQVTATWRAGKSVYCEKPLANTASAARQMHANSITASGAQGAPGERPDASADAAPGVPPAADLVRASQVAFVMRFLPAVARSKDLIAAGEIGEVLSFRARIIHGGYLNTARPMSWRLDQAQSGGGALADLGVHMIDMIHFVLGEMVEVDARTRTFVTERTDVASGERVQVEVDDWAQVNCVLQSGAVGSIEASRAGDGQEETTLEIFGTQGSLRISPSSPYVPHRFRRKSGQWVVRDDQFAFDGPYTRAVLGVYPTPRLSLGPMVDMHLASLYWWLRRVAVVADPAVPADVAAGIREGLLAQEVLAKAYQSAAARRT